MPNKILVSGKPDEYQRGGTYEKLSETHEFVAGRIGALGSASGELKIFEAGDVPICVFDKQIADMGRDADGNYDDNYAVHDGSIDALYGDFVFNGTLKDGEVIAENDLLEAETATGKLVKCTYGIPCAMATHALSPSGADGDLICRFLPNRSSLFHYVVEALTTPTAHVFGLDHVPLKVDYVEAITATAAGPKTVGYSNSTPAAGDCYVDPAVPDIQFNATDAVTVAEIGYWYQ